MRTHHTLTLGLAVFLAVANIAHATEAPQLDPVEVRTPTLRVHPDLLALRKQMADHPELPPVSFWLAVARCETGHGLNGQIQWRRGEHWKVTTVTGAMGIASSAWRGYGGYKYAERAAKASPWAQIIVANRIGFLGYQTKNLYRTLDDRLNNRPLFRPAAGFSQGWGGKCREAWERKHGKP